MLVCGLVRWFFLFVFPEMLNLTTRLCWVLVKKEGYIAIWQKPVNNTCYLSRGAGVSPPLCNSEDDPDNVWYVSDAFNFPLLLAAKLKIKHRETALVPNLDIDCSTYWWTLLLFLRLIVV
jgi:hypothetical protein